MFLLLLGRHRKKEPPLAGRSKQGGISIAGTRDSTYVAAHIEQFIVEQAPVVPLRCAFGRLAQPPQKSTMELSYDTRVRELQGDDDDVGSDGEYEFDDDISQRNDFRPRRCKRNMNYANINDEEDSAIDNTSGCGNDYSENDESEWEFSGRLRVYADQHQERRRRESNPHAFDSYDEVSNVVDSEDGNNYSKNIESDKDSSECESGTRYQCKYQHQLRHGKYCYQKQQER